MPPLVLASTSPFRRALLDRLGLAYRAVKPPFDEIEPPGVSPVDCARLFAEGKARSVMAQLPGSVVIGADQALELGGAMLRKPHDEGEALGQLLSLAGRWHALHSAVAVGGPAGEVRSEIVTVELKMRALTEAEARRYLSVDQPSGSVGSYLFERRGVALFDEVRGQDDSAIVGLPLVALCRLLRAAGVALF